MWEHDLTLRDTFYAPRLGGDPRAVRMFPTEDMFEVLTHYTLCRTVLLGLLESLELFIYENVSDRGYVWGFDTLHLVPDRFIRSARISRIVHVHLFRIMFKDIRLLVLFNSRLIVRWDAETEIRSSLSEQATKNGKSVWTNFPSP